MLIVGVILLLFLLLLTPAKGIIIRIVAVLGATGLLGSLLALFF